MTGKSYFLVLVLMNDYDTQCYEKIVADNDENKLSVKLRWEFCEHKS